MAVQDKTLWLQNFKRVSRLSLLNKCAKLIFFFLKELVFFVEKVDYFPSTSDADVSTSSSL